jgi:hypothetical protein
VIDQDTAQAERLLLVNRFDLALKQLAEKAAGEGIARETIMRLFIDHALDVLNNAPGRTPAQARHNAEAVLQEAMRMHSMYDDSKDAI